MKRTHLVKLITENRSMIQRHMQDAVQNLDLLKRDCLEINDDLLDLNLLLNAALVETCFHSRYDKALKISLKALEDFQQCRGSNAFSWHYRIAGECYIMLDHFEDAMHCLKQALLEVNEAEEDASLLKIESLLMLAMNNENKDIPGDESVELMSEAIALAEKSSYKSRLAGCHMGMGNVLQNRGRFKEALHYFELSAREFEKEYDLRDMAAAYSNIGTSYIGMQNFEKAEEYLLKSVELRRQFSSPDQLSISYHNLAIVYKEIGDLKRSREMLVLCRDILHAHGNKAFLESTHRMIEDLERAMAR